MPEQESPYLARLRKGEAWGTLKSLVPAFVRSYRLMRRYRAAYPGAFVSSGAAVAPEAQIGSGCVVRTRCDLGPTVVLGRYSTLGDACLLRGSGRIEIGAFCSIGPEVVVISENHASDRVTTYPIALYRDLIEDRREFIPADIVIGPDVWIGQRAIVLSGARIGTGCVVGAGSVVTRGDYEPFTVLAGVPARAIKQRLDENKRQALLKSEWWLRPAEQVFGDWDAMFPGHPAPYSDGR